jgi:hypothetical protein
LLGFDFLIGLPRAYAASAGAGRYIDWLRSLPDDTRLFDVATDIADFSPARPFFPQNITVKSPGIKSPVPRGARAFCRGRAASLRSQALQP